MCRIAITTLVAAITGLTMALASAEAAPKDLQVRGPATGSGIHRARPAAARAFFENGGHRLYAARHHTRMSRRGRRAGHGIHTADNEWRYVPVRRYRRSLRRRIRLRLKSFHGHARAPKKKPVVCGCKPKWDRVKPH